MAAGGGGMQSFDAITQNGACKSWKWHSRYRRASCQPCTKREQSLKRIASRASTCEGNACRSSGDLMVGVYASILVHQPWLGRSERYQERA